MKTSLIIRLSSLGDVVLSSFLIDYLKDSGYEVDFLTYSDYELLFKGDRRIRRVIVLKRRGRNDYNLKALSKEKYEVIFDLHTKPRTILLRRYLRAERFCIWRAERFRRYLYLFSRLSIFKPHHILQRYHREAYEKGYRPRICLSEEEGIFEIPSWKRGEKYIAVFTGSAWKSKRYDENLFLKAINIIVEALPVKVILLSSLPEFKGERIFLRSEKIIEVKNPSLNFLKTSLKNALFTISNDTGPAHLSEALGTPVLIIYTSTSPHLGFTPFREESSYIWSGLFCSPCSLYGRMWCPRNLACIRAINPEEVAGKALQIYKRLEGREPKLKEKE